MLKKNITEPILQQKISSYLASHQDDYTEEEKEYIMRNYCYGMYTDFTDPLLRQIYSELNLMDDEHNIYLGFISILSKIHGIDKNIVEVGCGRLPSLAKYIALRQKTGTITVYDPKLISIKHPSNLKLCKERFTSNTSIANVDLIIGFMPTLATEDILSYAYENKKDFVIALSDILTAKDIYEQEDIWTDWQQSIIYDAKEKVKSKGLGTLGITTLSKYDNPYPIIYNH